MHFLQNILFLSFLQNVCPSWQSQPMSEKRGLTQKMQNLWKSNPTTENKKFGLYDLDKKRFGILKFATLTVALFGVWAFFFSCNIRVSQRDKNLKSLAH